MSQKEPPVDVAAPTTFLGLVVNGDEVTVQGENGLADVVSFQQVPDLIAANPQARFVVQDAHALFGRLLNTCNVESQVPVWAVLTGNRVIDIGLATTSIRLAGSVDHCAATDPLPIGARRLQTLMSSISDSSSGAAARVEKFGLLGHGLRVRAAASIGAIADRKIQLASGAKEELIDLCQRRAAGLEKQLCKASPELGGFFGREKSRPEALLRANSAITSWLAKQVKGLRDVHGAAVYPFLALTNEALDENHPEAWPLWALGVPAVPRLAALLSTAKLWQDLTSAEDDTIRPAWTILPRFQVTAFDLEVLPGVDTGRYLASSDGYLPIRLSFRKLTAAAVAAAAMKEGYKGNMVELLADGRNPIELIAELWSDRLSSNVSAPQRIEWVHSLVRYIASAGGPDGIKDFAETASGIDTNLSVGDYRNLQKELCQTVFPELGNWLSDCLIDWVEQSLPTPPPVGTLRGLVSPTATKASSIAETFASPKGTWGNETPFRFYRLVREHPEWGMRSELIENRTPLTNYRMHGTKPVESPAGLFRPHLPWWANRAESWRTGFDEAALNLVAKLTAAGHCLTWASENGIWLSVPKANVQADVPEVNQLATEAVGEVLQGPFALFCSFN